MGNICGRTATSTDPPSSMQERGVARASVQRQPEVEEPSASSQQQSRTSSTRESAGHEEMDVPVRSRRGVESAPQHRGVSQMHSPRVQSVAPPSMKRETYATSMASHLEPRTTCPGPPKGRVPAVPMSMSYTSHRSLTPTVRQVLRDHVKFRILVVGRRGSGKSSLIKSVFKVNMSAAPAKVPGKADIDLEFHPEDNRYLVVHESSGLEPGDAQGLETIRNFILYRTDPCRSAPERLHAVWICVPASDAIDGSIGEGVKEVLGVRRVPVIVTFTKFDSVVSKFVTDFEGGNLQHYESARTTAYARCEQSCLSVFGRELKDVPAEIVSVDSRFHDLIDKLVVTTDKFMTGRRTVSTFARLRAQMTKPRVAPIPLAWSAALRVCQDIMIQASIEVGRSRYWRNLWSSLEFSNQPLKNCVHTIHLDIVEIWNLNERARCLSSTEVMGTMSYVVKDLATSNGNELLSPVPTESGDKFAEWVDDMYRGSPENVQCVMGYIVDLTVVLDGIFRTTEGSVSLRDASLAVDRHLRSSRRDRIHQDIRSFVTQTFSLRFTDPQKDLLLEKIMDLIRQYCVPHFESSYGSSGNDWG